MPDEEFYGSVSDVKVLTGIHYGDLGFESDDEEDGLDKWIEARLAEIKILIDRDRNRDDWEDQGWLLAIDGIANRWCAEHIRFAMAHRDSPIVKVDDYTVELPTDEVPGKGILADLRRFLRKADDEATRKRFMFSMGRVDTEDENEDEVVFE